MLHDTDYHHLHNGCLFLHPLHAELHKLQCRMFTFSVRVNQHVLYKLQRPKAAGGIKVGNETKTLNWPQFLVVHDTLKVFSHLGGLAGVKHAPYQEEVTVAAHSPHPLPQSAINGRNFHPLLCVSSHTIITQQAGLRLSERRGQPDQQGQKPGRNYSCTIRFAPNFQLLTIKISPFCKL